jgi:diguanylate cyclase (GGDEF)-like protein
VPTDYIPVDLPVDQVVEDVAAVLTDATTVNSACQRTVNIIARRTPAMIAALLRVHDHLRTVAATGSWSVFSSTPLGRGPVGRTYETGVTIVRTDVDRESGHVPLGPIPSEQICVPIRVTGHPPIGVLNVEWVHPVDVYEWRPILEAVGRLLAQRIDQLGGPPVENRTETLLRHGLAMTSATELSELLTRSLIAAREVSGLSTPVVLLPDTDDGARAYYDRTSPTALGIRLAELDPIVLATLAVRARRHGASYTLGDPAALEAHGFETLTAIGAKTMITVPIGPGRDPAAVTENAGGVLLVVDEAVSRPDAGTVNLLELLAAQAWTAVDRLQTMAILRERAVSDPLTGLGHTGPFGERLARAAPDRTALLVVDVDRFKDINDTFGHQAGDKALVDLSRALLEALRAGDELYRIGGDEFAAVLDVARPEEAVRIANRLVRAAHSVGRSVSVGVALHLADESPKDTLRRADTALYEAKRTGRDSARVAQPIARVA